MLLGDEDSAKMRDVAEKVDRLMVLHMPQSHEARMAAMALLATNEDDIVSAIAGAGWSCKCNKCKSAIFVTSYCFKLEK
jgi:hypothetical protein